MEKSKIILINGIIITALLQGCATPILGCDSQNRCLPKWMDKLDAWCSHPLKKSKSVIWLQDYEFKIKKKPGFRSVKLMK